LGDAVARPRDDRQKDLLRPALDEIIDLGNPLVRLGRAIDWGFLDRRFASVCTPGPGQPGLPTRLVAGLFIAHPSDARNGFAAVMHLVLMTVRPSGPNRISGDGCIPGRSCVMPGAVTEYSQLPDLISSSAPAGYVTMPAKSMKTAVVRTSNFPGRSLRSSSPAV
jgi:hypothetical protein